MDALQGRDSADLSSQGRGNIGPNLIAYMVTLSSFCIFITSLRFYIRRQVLRNVGMDDWFVAMSTASLVTSIGAVVAATEFGLGQHFSGLTHSHQSIFLTLLWFAGLGYHIIIMQLKCAFLLQYRRAFPLPTFQRLCDVFLAFIAVWSVAGLIAPVAVCLPIQDQWKPENVGPRRFCLARLNVWIVHGSIHVFTDVLIFIMPLPLIKTLPLTKLQRAALTAVFCLGFCTCAISVVRLCTLRPALLSADASRAMATTCFWSVAEATCAITCLCIPVLRPLLAGREGLRRWRRHGRDAVPGTHPEPELRTASSEACTTIQVASSRTESRGSVGSLAPHGLVGERGDVSWELERQGPSELGGPATSESSPDLKEGSSLPRGGV